MHNRESIEELLRNNSRAVGRALIALRNRQTADEVATESTRWQNGRGFTAAHARRGVSMANFFERTGFLTPRQLAWWRAPAGKSTSRIGQYSLQLLEVAKEREQMRPQSASVT